MSRAPSPEPRLACAALLIGMALLVGRGQGRFPDSPLIDVDAWRLEEPDIAGRMSRMREAITGPPDEARRRWRRMMKARRIAPRPPPKVGAGPTAGLATGDGRGATGLGAGSFRFTGTPGASQLSGLTEAVVHEALSRKVDRVAAGTEIGAMGRQSADAPRSGLRRRRRQLGEVVQSYPAGKALPADVLSDDLTRWQRCKEVLKSLGGAYVNQDLIEFMRQFSKNAALDLTVLRNAVQEDFEQDADIHLDFELMEYRVNFDSVQIRLRWLRGSTLQSGTPTAVVDGVSDLIMDRHDGFRIKSWRGLPPFGRRDDAFLAQVRAGQPNLELEASINTDPNVGGTATPSPSPSPPPPTAIETIPTITVVSGGAACVDFDLATPAEVSCFAAATGDIQLLDGGFGVGYTVLNGNASGIQDCNDATPLADYQSMSFPLLTSFSGNLSGVEIGSVLTGGGVHVIYEITYTDPGSGANTDWDIRYMRNSSSTVNPAGSANCP